MPVGDNLYFHTAEVYVKPTSANANTIRVGVIQEVSIEIKRDLKELFGEGKYAVDVASGNESISGKYKSGEFDPNWLAENFLAATRSTGTLELVRGELGTVAAGEITVAGAADYSEDYGVIDQVTDKPLKRVASAPAVGQYSVDEATGEYTFNATDNGKKVLISYLKETATGETYTVSNSLAGDSVYCSLFLYKTSRSGKKFGLRLANATFESASFGFKLNEHTMPEGAFKGFAGANGKVFEIMKEA